MIVHTIAQDPKQYYKIAKQGKIVAEKRDNDGSIEIWLSTSNYTPIENRFPKTEKDLIDLAKELGFSIRFETKMIEKTMARYITLIKLTREEEK